MRIFLPCAGESSRFPGTRPKWLLTNPNGRTMSDCSLDGLPKEAPVTVVVLKSHLEKYFSSKKSRLIDSFSWSQPVDVCVLDTPTRSQVETITAALQLTGYSGPLLIKDCDNAFSLFGNLGSPDGLVCVSRVQSKTRDVDGKSFAKTKGDRITRVIEKRVVSGLFCAGGYYFPSSGDFALAAPGQGYISGVVNNLISAGVNFRPVEVGAYEDWGTLEAWGAYRATFKTLFIDLDGVLLKNAGEHTEPNWRDAQGLKQNILALRKAAESGRTHIIITTARPEHHRASTLATLAALGVPFHVVLMGLPHARRILINDFADPTNPYPSATAINLPRDSETLSHYL